MKNPKEFIDKLSDESEYIFRYMDRQGLSLHEMFYLSVTMVATFLLNTQLPDDVIEEILKKIHDSVKSKREEHERNKPSS
jgi:TRAP-type uncharacterized transport system substrate-binding protein